MQEDILEPEMYAAVFKGGELSRIPTESKVRDILQPFRPERTRKVARVYVDCVTSNWKNPYSCAPITAVDFLTRRKCSNGFQARKIRTTLC